MFIKRGEKEIKRRRYVRLRGRLSGRGEFENRSPTLLSHSTSYFVVYYESIKRDLKRRLIYEYRCDERLITKNEESTRLTHTGFVMELEHLKTKTRFEKKTKSMSS